MSIGWGISDHNKLRGGTIKVTVPDDIPDDLNMGLLVDHGASVIASWLWDAIPADPPRFSVIGYNEKGETV